MSDSSTDPNDAPNDSNNNDQFASGAVGNSNSILSDSDDRHSYAFAFKLRQTPMSLVSCQPESSSIVVWFIIDQTFSDSN